MTWKESVECRATNVAKKHYFSMAYHICIYNSIPNAYSTTRYAISHIWENAKKAEGERRGSQKPGYSNKIQNTATARNEIQNTKHKSQKSGNLNKIQNTAKARNKIRNI